MIWMGTEHDVSMMSACAFDRVSEALLSGFVGQLADGLPWLRASRTKANSGELGAVCMRGENVAATLTPSAFQKRKK